MLCTKPTELESIRQENSPQLLDGYTGHHDNVRHVSFASEAVQRRTNSSSLGPLSNTTVLLSSFSIVLIPAPLSLSFRERLEHGHFGFPMMVASLESKEERLILKSGTINLTSD
nr:hypothetical protein Iba_chr11aCG10700 [Ipomoea batatas]